MFELNKYFTGTGSDSTLSLHGMHKVQVSIRRLQETLSQEKKKEKKGYRKFNQGKGYVRQRSKKSMVTTGIHEDLILKIKKKKWGRRLKALVAL